METYLFTSELRDVLTAARLVARRRQDQCVATEHYLLTLVEDPPQGVASIFEELWLDRAVCRSSAQQAIPQNAPPLDQSDLPYTRGAAALVDQVGEVISVSAEQREPVPQNIDRKLKDIALNIYRLEDELLIILNPDQLISSEPT